MSAAAPIAIVRKPGARRMKLVVDPLSGAVRLTLPKRAALAPALAWAEAQAAWIAAQRARLPAPRPFVPGADIPFGDGVLRIDWAPGRPRRTVQQGARLVVGGPREALAARVTAWLKRAALETLTAETQFFAEQLGVRIAKVAIGDPRSRWGSCAASGVIRYSWRLICAPVLVRRATVAHEVAHRVHMHHGPAFHALVAELVGADAVTARAWLKREGAALHWLGRDGDAARGGGAL